MKEKDKEDKLKKFDEARRAERQYQKGGRLEEVVNDEDDEEQVFDQADEIEEEAVDEDGDIEEPGGDEYEGDWGDNQRHGRGTLRLAGGGSYEGGFEAGRRSGQVEAGP